MFMPSQTLSGKYNSEQWLMRVKFKALFFSITENRDIIISCESLTKKSCPISHLSSKWDKNKKEDSPLILTCILLIKNVN